MDFRELRKFSLKLFIGFLALTAFIAIISVLSGDFGEIQLKILATTFIISAASICSMSCAAFMEKQKAANLGLYGIFLSMVAAILVIVGIWSEINSDIFWKTAFSIMVTAIAFAHAFLLLLPELDDRYHWIQKWSTGVIGLLALQIVFALWTEINDEFYYRLLAVVAIILGLQTLVVPILIKFRGGEAKKQLLKLDHVEGNIYRDATGKRFKVEEI